MNLRVVVKAGGSEDSYSNDLNHIFTTFNIIPPPLLWGGGGGGAVRTAAHERSGIRERKNPTIVFIRSNWSRTFNVQKNLFSIFFVQKCREVIHMWFWF